jgi:metal iron transporter
MTVQTGSARWRTGDMDDETDAEGIVEAGTAVGRQGIKMTNSWFTMILAILIWLFMAIMNVANLVFLGK